MIALLTLAVIVWAAKELSAEYWTQIGKEYAKDWNDKKQAELERWFDENAYKDL